MATALVWVIAAGAGLGKFTWGQIMSGNTKRLGDRAIQALRPGCFEERYRQRAEGPSQAFVGLKAVFREDQSFNLIGNRCSQPATDHKDANKAVVPMLVVSPVVMINYLYQQA